MRLTLISVIIFTVGLKAQFSLVDAGIGLGGGTISGNSPSITVYSGEIFISINNNMWEDIYFKLAFHYAGDFDSFLPESRKNKYYSFIKGITATVFVEQKLSKHFFLSEGIGLAYLNDRIYPDINQWAIGTAAFVSINYNFFDYRSNESGFSIGLILDYAAAFGKTNPTYSLAAIEIKRVF